MRPAWARDRPWVFDTFLALCLGGVSVAFVASLDQFGDEAGLRAPTSFWQWLIAVGPAVFIPFRRIVPTTAVIGGAGAQAVLWLSDMPDSFLSMIVLLYSAAVYGGHRGRIWSGITAGALTLFTICGVLLAGVPFYAAPVVALMSVAALAFGTTGASRQAYTQAVEERALDAERSQAVDRDRALSEERNRIARELHDVVAHGLSVIVVQSAAAQRILDRDPEGARSALDQIELTGRRALSEMRQVLSVVRTDPNESWRPAPGLASLDELIEELEGVGLRVSLREVGEEAPPELPVTLDMTAYRIVQESLTNVLKHGGRGAKATVEIAHTPTSLDVSITDNGRGASAEDLGGHGLRGMQERVEVFGGDFEAGPRRGGGFAVHVSLPLEGARVR